MKITPELLQKYASGDCTDQERLTIERWLPSDADKTDSLSDDFLNKETALIWDAISKDIELPKKIDSKITIYKKIAPYAAVACVTLLVSVLFFFPTKAKDANISKGFLYVYSTQNEITKTKAEHCNITYSGTIIISNTSSEVKSITCSSKSTKTFKIEPGSIYYLRSRKEGSPFLVKENDPTELVHTSRYLRGTYALLCASI